MREERKEKCLANWSKERPFRALAFSEVVKLAPYVRVRSFER
jgi:hypothetical protein